MIIYKTEFHFVVHVCLVMY